MRARLIISLAVILSNTFGHARAEEPSNGFDDDFGTLPPPAAAQPAPRPAPAPARPAKAQAAAPAPARAAAPTPAPAVAAPAPTPVAPPATPAAAAPAPEPSPPSTASSASAGHGYPPLDEESPPAAVGTPDVDRISRAFVHPTLHGLLGGVHAVDANSAWPGTFRAGLSANVFRKNGFITRGDQHRRAGATLTINVTPIEHLELAVALATYTTANRTTQPDVIQVIGDTHLSAKGYTRVLPWLSVGGDMMLSLLNGVGDIGVRGAATGVGLRANATFDLRGLKKPLPIIVRSNLRYVFDNSARLVRDVERQRYDALANRASGGDEYRHLVSPSERYALQVNRLDRIGPTVGVEVPYRPREGVQLSPMLEWGFALPVNRQDFNCVKTRIPSQDSCLATEGFSARPSVMTFGVRAQPYIPGLALLFAVDVATSGHRTFVREFAPTERYMLQFGLSYAYDPHPLPFRSTRVVRVEVASPEIKAHVNGQVVDGETGAPVPTAIVHFEGTSLSELITDTRGAFRSAELAPGPQGMRIRAEGYREALCVAVVPSAGGDVSARCELAPSVRFGGLAGRIVDPTGAALQGARLLLHGPAELTLTANADGSFESDKVPQGEYEVEAQAENYFPRRARTRISAGQRSTLGMTLFVRSRVPQVRLLPTRILLKKGLLFSDDGVVLDPKSEPLIAELADLLRTHPELTHVEIQGHMDPQASPTQAQVLSEQRAQAVRSALIDAGIAPSRLEAVGLGSTKPLMPNITAGNRSRNRRIELVIK